MNSELSNLGLYTLWLMTLLLPVACFFIGSGFSSKLALFVRGSFGVAIGWVMTIIYGVLSLSINSVDDSQECLNVIKGDVVYEAVSEAFGLPYVPVEKYIGEGVLA